MNVFMISGYKRTGKDTFFSILTGHNPNSYFWLVYKLKSSDISDDIFYNQKKILKKNLPFTVSDSNEHKLESKFIRVSFSDRLKESIFNRLVKEKRISSTFSVERDKDKIIGPDNKSFRDELIKEAMIKKKQDENYWVKKVHNNLLSIIEDGNIPVITDYRFPHEEKYLRDNGFNPITIRLYRSDISSYKDIIENQLDNSTFDFVCISDIKDEQKMESIFGKQYRFIGLIN